MLKNRLIFVLLYDNGIYKLSRNFRLQTVGNIEWLKENFDYDSIAYAVDELIVLNVSRTAKNIEKFCLDLKRLTSQYFMPIAAGGGVTCLEDAREIFDSGADKIVLNTLIYKNKKMVEQLINIYGSQSIVASIDYEKSLRGSNVFISNGSEKIGKNVLDAAKYVEEIGVGEIFLTSIEDDGVGEGFDYITIQEVSDSVSIPVIANGGCGRFEQFAKVYKECGVKAAATADLYNFMADGLKETRKFLIQNGIELAKWDCTYFKV